MNLLKVDNKLIAIQISTLLSFNISDHLANQTIRKIILNNQRLAILTSIGIYYLYVSTDFVLVNITNHFKSVLDISNIKFLVNYAHCSDNISIITNDNGVYTCVIDYDEVEEVGYRFHFEGKDIIAVSNEDFGYVYKKNNKYVIKGRSYYDNVIKVHSLDGLPTKFFGYLQFVYDNKILDYDHGFIPCHLILYKYIVRDEDISHMFTKLYYLLHQRL